MPTPLEPPSPPNSPFITDTDLGPRNSQSPDKPRISSSGRYIHISKTWDSIKEEREGR